ncbi:helix-turn-helix domain-containing protein [Tannockella kyphosi]|uniref:helix-turn-helix domain-containing protein n=1 Tax=Tannockella kyphosi TaxID=2899121 RepID=UPI0020113EEC|nr:helix-turn-helix transcriptional regulator [Tannockella kyphosi]
MIGERIQFLRNEHNLKQEELAKILKIGHSTLAAYEQNKRKPKVETIILIAKYFNVSTDFILELTNKPDQQYNQGKTLVDNKHFVSIPDSLWDVEVAIDEFELLKEFIVYKYNK